MREELSLGPAPVPDTVLDPVLRSRPRLVAVGGGKGGVGKTFVVANLAAALARSGHPVVVVDADLDGANLHTALGLAAPRVSLADYVAQREDDVGKLVSETAIPNLRLIAGTQGNLGEAQPDAERRKRLLEGLTRLPARFVLVDLGAGHQPALVDYFLAADDGVIVLTPEPTSVENAYGFLRAAFYRRMHDVLEHPTVRRVIAEAMDQRNERGIRAPADLLREVQAIDASAGAAFLAAVARFRPSLVVNEVRTSDEIKLGFAVRSVCKKYFGIEADYLGYVNHDDAARRSVLARRTLVELTPGADAAVYLERIARKLAHPARLTGRPNDACA